MIEQKNDYQPATLEIAPSGEPVLTLAGDLVANDLIEVRVENDMANIVIDGRLLGRTQHLTDTMQTWLVLAEEVAVRAANADNAVDTTVYAPVYNYNPNAQRRI